LSYWRRLTGAFLSPRYGNRESVRKEEFGVREKQARIFHRYNRESDGCRRYS
jgi:hypothetical protein